MPKHRKRKVKSAAKPLAVPSLDNKPRYSTPEVQPLPTPAPIPAIRARIPGEYDARGPLVGAEVSLRPTKPEDTQQVLEEEQAAQEDKSAHGGISDKEDPVFEGPWVAKGNPPAFLGSDDEEELDQMGRERAYERMGKPTTY